MGILLLSERSERDTIIGVQIRADAVCVCIHLVVLRTPPHWSIKINVFELG